MQASDDPSASVGEVDLTGGSDGKISSLDADQISAATTTRLLCGTNQLQELPPFIGTLSKLVLLDCNDNWLSALPPELGRCEQLEELLLYKNSIKALPKELSELRSLKVLNIFNNKVTRLPAELGQLPALEEVNLAANKLMALPEVPGWSRVRILNLYDNRLVKIGSLAGCVALVELRLYNNNLEAMPMLPPGEESSIELIELNNNRIASMADDYFASTPLCAGSPLHEEPLPSSLTSSAAVSYRRRQSDWQPPRDADRRQLCWPGLETLFIGAIPSPRYPASSLFPAASCVVTGTALDATDETSKQLMLAILKRPGGSFWTVNGRRWVSDEARAASFAQSKQKTLGPANLAEGLAALGIGQAAGAGAAADGVKRAAEVATEEEDDDGMVEYPALVCDEC